jgi:hypothetical protein
MSLYDLRIFCLIVQSLFLDHSCPIGDIVPFFSYIYILYFTYKYLQINKKPLMNEKKLRKIIEKIYIEELLGRSIYNSHSDAILEEECEKLRVIAYEYENLRMKKLNTEDKRKQVEEQIDRVHSVAMTLPNYRKSKIYFTKQGEQTGLF